MQTWIARGWKQDQLEDAVDDGERPRNNVQSRDQE